MLKNLIKKLSSDIQNIIGNFLRNKNKRKFEIAICIMSDGLPFYGTKFEDLKF